MISIGATKLAAKATESALKFGEIASQKVVQVSETVGEKVKFHFSSLFFYAYFFACYFGIRKIYSLFSLFLNFYYILLCFVSFYWFACISCMER